MWVLLLAIFFLVSLLLAVWIDFLVLSIALVSFAIANTVFVAIASELKC